MQSLNATEESMSISLLVLLAVAVCFSIKLVGKSTTRLPPCRSTIPIIGRYLFVTKSMDQIEKIICSLHSKLGPIISLGVGPRTALVISSRTLAHQAFIRNGAVFADRPKWLSSRKFINRELTVTSEPYGVTWRYLRRSIAEILHPSRTKAYSNARKQVLGTLLTRLKSSVGVAPVQVMDHFQFTIFCLLARMCFDDKLNKDQANKITTVHRPVLPSFKKYEILHLWPALTRILLRSWWTEYLKMRKDQVDVILPLIKAREQQSLAKRDHVTTYVDTLLQLELEVDGKTRNLTEQEMVNLCSEFMNAGTDTPATSLQWIMANIVKYPRILDRLFQEMKSVLGADVEEVEEEDLPKLPYLKADSSGSIEGHPPSHFILPHGVTEETELGGYVVPKNAMVNISVAKIGRDPEVWENPTEFKPERLLQARRDCYAFDITGSKEIKMMPFGVGRTMCRGYGLAMLHLEYFVANLVWKFEWKADKGDEVDMTEKSEFTVVMKHPLRVEISHPENK